MKGAIIAAGAVIVAGGAAAAVASRKVRYLENAAGTHPALRALLTAWDSTGTHTVTVAPAGTDWPIPGGLRLEVEGQAQAAALGLSNATTLRDTPHGRGAALDVWPDGFNPRRGFDVQPSMKQLFQVFGEWAELQAVRVGSAEFSFTWGGRFSKPDMPHVEIYGWRSLPFPPPPYGEGFA